tara:strand:- start:2620 stop:3381 length:762 start_codon:yes stop_codon:yes gene_type:complete
MIYPRLIPVLLIDNRKLVKGVQYKSHKYVGDPVNAIKVFNEKQVDEITFFDVSISSGKQIDFEFISEIASEAFIPFGYGGGIRTLDDVKKLINIGVEKIILNTSAIENPDFIDECVQQIGSSSVVIKIDYKRSFFGKEEVYSKNGSTKSKINILDFCEDVVERGAGEIILSDISRDGTGKGFDIDFVKKISNLVNIPIVASSGSKGMESVRELIKKTNCSAAAAGDMFIYYGRFKSVLITYPDYSELKEAWKK